MSKIPTPTTKIEEMKNNTWQKKNKTTIDIEVYAS